MSGQPAQPAWRLGGPVACPNCGGVQHEPGFVDDLRQGRVHWIAGALEVGPFGGTRKAFRRRTRVAAYRCVRCSRLELYAVG